MLSETYYQRIARSGLRAWISLEPRPTRMRTDHGWDNEVQCTLAVISRPKPQQYAMFIVLPFWPIWDNQGTKVMADHCAVYPMVSSITLLMEN